MARDTHLDDFNTENDTCHSRAADNCHFIHCQDFIFPMKKDEGFEYVMTAKH
jgi:hypothetical protein